jgi:hypothetical protein
MHPLLWLVIVPSGIALTALAITFVQDSMDYKWYIIKTDQWGAFEKWRREQRSTTGGGWDGTDNA